MSLTSKKVGENNIDLFKILRAFNTPQNIKSQFSGFLAKNSDFGKRGFIAMATGLFLSGYCYFEYYTLLYVTYLQMMSILNTTTNYVDLQQFYDLF